MRSACLAIGLFACVAAARADWQPVEPPPVPPETERAQRGRAAPAPAERSAAPNAPVARSAAQPQTTASDGPSRVAQPGAASAAPAYSGGDSTPAARVAPPVAASAAPAYASDASTSAALFAQAGAASQQLRPQDTGSAQPIAASGARLDVEALRMFPPAPPPVVPGVAPERPITALTSFGPAPEPPPRSATPASAHAPPTPATVTAASPPADAADPAAADSGSTTPLARATELWSAAALFGVGATFDNTVAGVNPLGFGFGVRGDYRIRPVWSVGARLLYFVGGSVELPTHDVVMQSWLLAAEGAYVLDLEPLTIQPGLVLGLLVRETNYRGFATFITEEPTSLSLSDTTRLFFYLAPGLNVSLPLALATPALAPLTVGADVRLDLGFGRRVTGNIQLLGQVGLRF